MRTTITARHNRLSNWDKSTIERRASALTTICRKLESVAIVIDTRNNRYDATVHVSGKRICIDAGATELYPSMAARSALDKATRQLRRHEARRYEHRCRDANRL